MNDLSYPIREEDVARGYVKPEHPPEGVNAAGKVIRQLRLGGHGEVRPGDLARAVAVVDNFRAAHQGDRHSWGKTMNYDDVAFALYRFYDVIKRRFDQEGGVEHGLYIRL